MPNEYTFTLTPDINYTIDVPFWNITADKITLNGKVKNGFAITNCNTTILDLTDLDMSELTHTNEMFNLVTCQKLLFSKHTSNKLTDTSSMFNCCNIENADLSLLNTSNVTNMSKMFNYSTFKNLNITNLNMKNVIDTSYMFHHVTIINLIHTLDLLNVKTAVSMFDNAHIDYLNLVNFKINSSADIMYMFADAHINCLEWNTLYQLKYAKNISSIFHNCTIEKLNLRSIANVDVSFLKKFFDAIKAI